MRQKIRLEQAKERLRTKADEKSKEKITDFIPVFENLLDSKKYVEAYKHLKTLTEKNRLYYSSSQDLAFKVQTALCNCEELELKIEDIENLFEMLIHLRKGLKFEGEKSFTNMVYSIKFYADSLSKGKLDYKTRKLLETYNIKESIIQSLLKGTYQVSSETIAELQPIINAQEQQSNLNSQTPQEAGPQQPEVKAALTVVSTKQKNKKSNRKKKKVHNGKGQAGNIKSASIKSTDKTSKLASQSVKEEKPSAEIQVQKIEINLFDLLKDIQSKNRLRKHKEDLYQKIILTDCRSQWLDIFSMSPPLLLQIFIDLKNEMVEKETLFDKLLAQYSAEISRSMVRFSKVSDIFLLLSNTTVGKDLFLNLFKVEKKFIAPIFNYFDTRALEIPEEATEGKIIFLSVVKLCAQSAAESKMGARIQMIQSTVKKKEVVKEFCELLSSVIDEGSIEELVEQEFLYLKRLKIL